MKVLSQLLATTEGEEKKKKVNPIDKAKSTDVRTMVARLSLSYPVLRAAAHDPALRAMLLSELVSLSMEDGGGVVLPVGLRTHPVSGERWL